LALLIEAGTSAVRFRLDERVKSICDYSIFDERYGHIATREKENIWEESRELLGQGVDVILDWSLWSREARQTWTSRVLAESCGYWLFFLDVPMAALRERLAERNRTRLDGTHEIPLEELERFSKVFEPPSEDENLEFEAVVDSADVSV
jgi:predicted kinase